MNALATKVRDEVIRLLRLDRRIDEIKINQGLILAQLNLSRQAVTLGDCEFKVFSQWGEDGIIQYLVHHLAIRNRTFIEFGVEDFHESNCRFLMMKDRWRGFVIDGSEANITRLRSAYFYWQHPLECLASFITRENVAELLECSGFDKEVGILSVDIDGVDYHVLEALAAWKPSILIVEYNDVFGFERPVSVPYEADFVRRRKHWSNQYWGANLPAFEHLARQRGYALVGVNGVGSNAFFVRRELLNDAVCEVPMGQCRRPATYRDSRDAEGRLSFLSGAARSAPIADLPLVDVRTNELLKVGDLGCGP